MTAQEPGECHPSAAQCTETVYSFHGVFRARGNIAAGGWQQRRDCPLIGSKEMESDELGWIAHVKSAVFLSPLRSLFPFPSFPRLAPWAAFFRRFAAKVQGRLLLGTRTMPAQFLLYDREGATNFV
jgi:hypothetical protein